MTIPELATDRLILRGHRRDDFDDLHAMWSDTAVTRRILGRPSGHKESWDRLLRYSGLWGVLGFGYWAVILRDGGAYLGDVGFADFQRDLEPPLNGTPEAGWVFAIDAQGQGYAHEAVAAALAWADATLDHSQTAAIFAPDHARSIKLARAVGFQAQSTALFAGTDEVAVLTRPRLA